MPLHSIRPKRPEVDTRRVLSCLVASSSNTPRTVHSHTQGFTTLEVVLVRTLSCLAGYAMTLPQLAEIER